MEQMNEISWWNELTNDFENTPEYKAEVISMNIANDVFKIMKEAKLSKSELAKKMGVSKSYITQMLNGKSNMTVLSLVKLSDVLGIEVKIDLKKEFINDSVPNSFKNELPIRDILTNYLSDSNVEQKNENYMENTNENFRTKYNNNKYIPGDSISI